MRDDELPVEQQDPMLFGRAAPQGYPSMDEELPGQRHDDLSTNRITSNLDQILVTPPPSHPAPAYQEHSNDTLRFDEPLEQLGEQPATASPDPFDDWLSDLEPGAGTSNNPIRPHANSRPMTPERGLADIQRHLQGLGGSLRYLGQNDYDPDLPSNVMRPPISPYMQQFQPRPDHELGEDYWFL